MFTGQIVVNFAIVIAVGTIGFMVKRRWQFTSLWQFYTFSALFLISIVLCRFVNHNLELMDIVNSIFLIGITRIMLLYKWKETEGAIAFFLAAVAILLKVMRSSSGNILSISSNNYISILLILMLALYYIPFEWNRKQLAISNLIPAIVAFGLSVVAAGRGGILATGVLLAGLVMIMTFAKTKNRWIRLATALFAFVVLCLLILFENRLILDSLPLGNFKEEGMESSIRLRMWQQYFDTMMSSPLYIIFGAPVSRIDLLMEFNGNMHNSFIYLHAIAGILPFIFFFVSFINAIKWYLGNKHYIALLLMLVVVLRGMTDKFIFAQYGMPIMVYLVMAPYVGTVFNDKYCLANGYSLKIHYNNNMESGNV